MKRLAMVKKLPDDCMPACQSCSFFKADSKDELGFCYRYPPKVVHLGEGDFDSLFPVVARDEWCGEFYRFTN